MFVRSTQLVPRTVITALAFGVRREPSPVHQGSDQRQSWKSVRCSFDRPSWCQGQLSRRWHLGSDESRHLWHQGWLAEIQSCVKRQEGRRVDTSVVPTMANGTCARCASMLSDPITHLYSSLTGGGGVAVVVVAMVVAIRSLYI